MPTVRTPAADFVRPTSMRCSREPARQRERKRAQDAVLVALTLSSIDISDLT